MWKRCARKLSKERPSAKSGATKRLNGKLSAWKLPNVYGRTVFTRRAQIPQLWGLTPRLWKKCHSSRACVLARLCVRLVQNRMLRWPMWLNGPTFLCILKMPKLSWLRSTIPTGTMRDRLTIVGRLVRLELSPLAFPVLCLGVPALWSAF